MPSFRNVTRERGATAIKGLFDFDLPEPPAHPADRLMGPEGSPESRQRVRDDYDQLHAKIEVLNGTIAEERSR